MNESIAKYSIRLQKALETINQKNLDKLTSEILCRIDKKSNIFIVGNGGSHANAQHIVGDFMKTIMLENKMISIQCLGENACFVTATSNDVDYNDIYFLLVEKFIQKNDLLIYLSGSGNSINLVKCAQKAKDKNIMQAAIVGFSGGRLKEIVNIPIHTKVNDMEIAEDCQLAIFHNIKQNIIRQISNSEDSFMKSNKYGKRIYENVVS